MAEQIATPAPAPAPAAKPAPAAAAPAATPPSPAASDAAAKHEAVTGEPPPDQKRGETDAQYELRVAKLTREAKLARDDALASKSARAKAEEELAVLRAELDKAKAKRMTKREFRGLIEELAKDPAKERELLEDDDLPPSMQRLRDELEAERKRLREQTESSEREKETAAQHAQTQRELQIVGAHISGEAFPLFDGEAAANAAEHILKAWHSQWEGMGRSQEAKPDLDEVARTVHDALARNLKRALQSERSRNFLLGMPELKGLLAGAEARAGSPTSEAQGAGRTNERAAAPVPASPTTEKPTTEAQRRELRLAALREARDARAERQAARK